MSDDKHSTAKQMPKPEADTAQSADFFSDFPEKEIGLSAEKTSEHSSRHSAHHSSHRSSDRTSQSKAAPAAVDHSKHEHYHRGETVPREYLNDGEKADAKSFSSASDLDSSRRKMRRWKKRLIAALAILLVLVMIPVIAVYAQLCKIDYSDGVGTGFENPTEFISDSNPDNLDEISASDAAFNAADEVKAYSGVATTLIFVTDSDAGENGGPNCIMLFCRNKKSGEALLVSIPSDTYACIPGFSDNRIDAAYRLGGSALLVQSVEQSFGVKIDEYFSFDHLAIRDITEAVGGINIVINEDESDYLTELGYRTSSGENHLGGGAVLALTRAKTDDDSPFRLAERQRRILSFLQAGIHSSATALGNYVIMGDLFPVSQTSYTKIGVLSFLSSLRHLSGEKVESCDVPSESESQDAYINGMSVLQIINPQSVRDALGERLAEISK